MDKKRLDALKRYIQLEQPPNWLPLLAKAGIDDETLDYLSDGEWTMRKRLIGRSLADRYPVKPPPPDIFHPITRAVFEPKREVSYPFTVYKPEVTKDPFK